MKRNEISEIRRRLNADRNNITAIRACYVNDRREIVASFTTTTELLPHEDAEKYMSIFKRALSGQPERNLIDIAFNNAQVVGSEEHGRLLSLRDSALKDDDMVGSFFQLIIDSLDFDGNYLILLLHDAYDVPVRKQFAPDEDSGDAAGADSEEVFRYILCAICPVKQTKAALTYFEEKNDFHDRLPDWIVTAPELGFLFPCFDDRSTNIYNALYYTRDTGNSHQELVSALFKAEIPMPAAQQRETFQAVLAESLGEDCSCELIQNVHDQLIGRIEESRADKAAPAPVVTGAEVKELLSSCGIAEEKAETFSRRFNEEFGEARPAAQNLVDTRQFEVRTPDVVIKVSPGRSDLVQTRIIDGVKYILIRAEDSVEVGGVEINFPNE